MARPAQITRQTLSPLLMTRGPVSATDLAAALQVNRTTIVRALAGFGDELVTLGATRSTRYLLRRPVQHAGNRWPIYRLDVTGHARLWATLESLYERRWRIIWAEAAPAWAHRFSDAEGLWQGFPFFLADVRPQGFLGRAIARQVSTTLGVPADPRMWSDDHTLVYLQAAGEDLPGSLVVGDECLRRTLARAVYAGGDPLTAAAEREARYPALAQLAAGSLPGSSAGGEQPKFLTTLRNEAGAFQPVLVKFSPPMDQPTGRRWADLLLCEFHALEVLAERGLAPVAVRILDAGGRRFLEVPRFDRAGAGGRRGVVSLGALHPAAIGFDSRTAWTAAAVELQRDGIINADTTATVQRLHSFGELIGNSDMHAGNLAFWMDDALPFRITPAYDMLPMLWAPGAQGEIMERAFAPPPPLPASRKLWQEASAWAALFWDRVANDTRLSAEFGHFARTSSALLQRLRTM